MISGGRSAMTRWRRRAESACRPFFIASAANRPATRATLDVPLSIPAPQPVIAYVATYSNVRDMLTNPKHTGHMVWNRRARKGAGRNRMNPVSDWVWSPEPVHEAVVDLETFVQAQQVAGYRERSRTAAGLNPAPHARHVYRLRSYLYCSACGRRMFGNTKRQVTWYACAPKNAYRPDGHPVILRVREDDLIDHLAAFLSERVLKARRQILTPAQLASPLARRPYDFRHAGVSWRLNAGVPAPLVAEWAGHTVEVLLRIYAHCIEGDDDRRFGPMEDALGRG
jgi:Recombinase